MAIAIENVTKAAYLNVVQNVNSNMGSQLSMQSNLFGRLGLCLSSSTVQYPADEP